MYSLEKCLFTSFADFELIVFLLVFLLVLSFRSSLILLSVTWSADILSHSLSCPSILWIVPFDAENFLVSMKPNFACFFFFFLTSAFGAKKAFPNLSFPH